MAKKVKAKKKAKKTKKRESKQRNRLKGLCCKILLVLVITLAVYIGYCFVTIPNIEQAIRRTRQPSTLITAENGNEIQSYGSVYSAIIMPDDFIGISDRLEAHI